MNSTDTFIILFFVNLVIYLRKIIMFIFKRIRVGYGYFLDRPKTTLAFHVLFIINPDTKLLVTAIHPCVLPLIINFLIKVYIHLTFCSSPLNHYSRFS